MTHPISAAADARAVVPRALVRCAIAAGLVLASSATVAQGVVTLYGGVRAGGEFIDQNAGDATVKLDSGAAGSLSFEWLLADGRQAQLFYSYQRSALPGSVANGTGDIGVSISYLHIGGRVLFEGSDIESGSYLVGGLGVTHLSPSGHGLSSEVRPSMNLGLGYQWMLSKRMAVRTEVRGYWTLVHSSGGFFCSGTCVVAIRGDTMLQVEGMVGRSYGF
jgi:hypothetical protein